MWWDSTPGSKSESALIIIIFFGDWRKSMRAHNEKHRKKLAWPYCGMSLLTISALFLLYIHFGKSCVYTYPDIRMSEIRISSGRLHVSDRNVFGVYTCPDIRMHYTRPMMILAMCRRNTQMLFFLVKLHAFKLSSISSFLFVDVCWLDDKVNVLFGKFSYRL